MRIESITIKNFRQYRDAVFSFPQISDKPDIHIIIGENGEGKTNILNALTWCLYGEELHLGDRNTALKCINSQYVQELRSQGEKHGDVSVTVEMSVEEERSSIQISRHALFSITPQDAVNSRHDLLATINSKEGYKVLEKREDVEMLIHRFVPREICDYIFFDGEHLDEYFKSTKRESIENGIKDLTHVTYVEKAYKSIDAYVKSDIAPLLKRFGDSEVQKCQEELERAKKRYDDQSEKLKIIDEQIKEAEDKLQELESIIHGHDDLKSKTDELERLEEESNRLQKQLKHTLDNLMAFTREYFVYFALYSALKDFQAYIDKQDKAGNLPPKIDKSLVESIMSSHTCAICGHVLDANHLQHVVDILKKLEVSSATSAELNRASGAIRGIFEKMDRYEQLKKNHYFQLNETKRLITQNENDYSKLNNYLKTISNQDAIRKAIVQREAAMNASKNLIKTKGGEEYLRDQLKKQLEFAADELSKAMEKNQNMAIYRRQLEFCQKSSQILQQTAEEIMKESREEMQNTTFSIFEQLMWKKGAFSRVQILEDYSFNLLDIYGEQSLGSCSAAERALLALSFTLALQQTSGHDSLLYIDTPLGRVGVKNRINFASVLREIGEEKQVILSFTPSEFDENVQQEIGSSYSSYVELHYDINNGITTTSK